MAIVLSQEHLDGIRAEGETYYPNECCGFLLGSVDGNNRLVKEISPVDNSRDDGEKHNRYTISPRDFLEGEKLARSKSLDIIGFFHSHPDVAARPSEYDREHAWPWYSYVIVSVREGKAAEVTSWILEEDRSAMNEEQLETAG